MRLSSFTANQEQGAICVMGIVGVITVMSPPSIVRVSVPSSRCGDCGCHVVYGVGILMSWILCGRGRASVGRSFRYKLGLKVGCSFGRDTFAGHFLFEFSL